MTTRRESQGQAGIPTIDGEIAMVHANSAKATYAALNAVLQSGGAGLGELEVDSSALGTYSWNLEVYDETTLGDHLCAVADVTRYHHEITSCGGQEGNTVWYFNDGSAVLIRWYKAARSEDDHWENDYWAEHSFGYRSWNLLQPGRLGEDEHGWFEVVWFDGERELRRLPPVVVEKGP
jgi:hypothetical protein